MTSVRPAAVPDAPRLAEVHVRSWQAAYRGLISQDYLDNLDPIARAERWERSLAQPRAGETTLVAETAGRIVGFVNAGPYRDPDLDESVGEVRAIYVHPEWWSTGAGRALMAAAVTFLQDSGFTDAALWVIDTNERGRRFYERSGWKPDGASQEVAPFGGAVLEVRYRRPLP